MVVEKCDACGKPDGYSNATGEHAAGCECDACMASCWGGYTCCPSGDRFTRTERNMLRAVRALLDELHQVSPTANWWIEAPPDVRQLAERAAAADHLVILDQLLR